MKRSRSSRATPSADDPPPEWPDASLITALAQRVPPEVRFGGSSWTYPGWRGLIYHRDYPATGASAAQLEEYARWPLFRTVGIDSFFYAPPSSRTLHAYSESLPPGFPCVSKVWDQITAHTFKAGHRTRNGPNPDWLDSALFIDQVLDPMREHFGQHLGPLVFEFQTIARQDECDLPRFVSALDRFFGALPEGPQYAVEIRNAEFLTPEYFAVLRDHRVAHVFNAWTRMPTIGEQLLSHESITADFVVARALLRSGRTYARAVDAFAPYDRIREVNPELRADLVALARTAVNLRIPAYVLANNRAEGCSPLTVAAVAAMLVESLE